MYTFIYIYICRKRKEGGTDSVQCWSFGQSKMKASEGYDEGGRPGI